MARRENVVVCGVDPRKCSMGDTHVFMSVVPRRASSAAVELLFNIWEARPQHLRQPVYQKKLVVSLRQHDGHWEVTKIRTLFET